MRKRINIVKLSQEYCKAYNIPEYDSAMILNEMKTIIEDYFEKQIYLTKNEIRFEENDKKISFSENLLKHLSNSLLDFMRRYVKSNTHEKDNYEIQYTVQKSTVYKKTEHGYYISFLDKYAFISKSETLPLELGEKYYFFIEKFNKKKGVYKAIVNHHKVAQLIIDKLLGERNRFKVNMYKTNNILSILYDIEKPSKEEIKKMRIYFKNEKIIYNMKEK